MLGDAWIVALKEWREVLVRGMGLRGSIGFFGLILLVFGVAIPARAGYDWVMVPWSALVFAWLPLMLVMAVIADSFAGERERHTLETLLASRLSDSAILLGKTGAAVAFAYGMLLLVSAMSLVSVNVAVRRPEPFAHPLMWSGATTFGVVVLGALFTVLSATIGVMVSLRSETVRQANLRLSMGLILFFPALGFILTGVWAVLPGPTQLAVLESVKTWQVPVVLGVIAVALAAVDALLLWIASRMFVRDKLILD
ncbi:MAG TPA: ABC-2 type transporter [Coriobacteriia bacterium]